MTKKILGKICKSLALVLALLFFVSLTYAQETTQAPKKTVAILEFQNKTNVADNNIGQRMATLIETGLVQSQRFNVIEREQLETIFKEQGLTLAGFATSETIEAGKIKGVDGILTGKITDYTVVPVKSDYNWTDKKGVVHYTCSYEIKVRVEANIKLIDTTTGEIKLAEAQDGYEKNYLSKDEACPSAVEVQQETEALTNKATTECVDKIIARIQSAYPLAGYVLKIEPKLCYIDLGSANGIKPKQKLFIYKMGEVLKHPVTGAIISQSKDLVAEVEVFQVESNFCKAYFKKTNKDIPVAVGDVVGTQ